MRKEFLNQEKWNILLFLFVMIVGYVSSVILIGGPVTYSAPAGILIGFLILEFWKYRNFKKEWEIKRQSSTWRKF